MKPFEIFRIGTHTATSGAEISFGAAELQGSAAAYDPAVHEAPMVIGHPATDAPAYGWVARVRIEDDRLVVDPSEVDPAFAEAVEKGRYKKRSASFYPPGHPANPKPGIWYLKHVGFLGAVPPAVKGLRPVQFGEIEGTVTFADWNGLTVASLFSRLRDWMIGREGQEQADAVLPVDDIDSLKFDAAQPNPAPADPIPTYVEHPPMTTPTPDELAARQADLDRAQAEFAQQQAAFAEQQRTARLTEITAFAENLVGQGRFPSGEKAGLVAFMAALPVGDDAVFEFAEAPGKTAKATPLDYLRRLLGGAKPLVHFGEVASAGGAVSFADSTAEITALSRRYIAEQAAVGRAVSAAEAVQFVMRSRR